MKHPHLYSPLKMGELTLANRIVMAPMTRSRAGQSDDSVSSLQVTYYGQRAPRQQGPGHPFSCALGCAGTGRNIHRVRHAADAGTRSHEPC